MLELQQVSKLFGGISACHDVSFIVQPRQIAGLIGPNGAGKTTIFNLITGVYAPSGGTIRFQGRDIAGMRPDRIVDAGIARTFQNIRLFPKLSVLTNVCIAVDNKVRYGLYAALLRLPAVTVQEKKTRERAMEYLAVVGLDGQADLRAENLPYGLQRKLEIARALALEPRLLLLDEPAAGMNPEESIELAALIRSIYEKFELTILLIEHHMDVVMELCQNIVVLNFGKKLAEGTPEAIQTNPEVLRAYLGEGYKRARN
ncbi:MAG: ABC transporter ATP-binding protein [Negativicutes bacterium]|nr:ABC transporter ATP-binding protein [Negativicutes bacterium]